MIKGGCTLWARQTIDSDIFLNKPDKWFKIWFYLVNKVNHADTKQFERGSAFIKYEWIIEKTKATKSEIDHCLRWLKIGEMVATQKATRGMIVFILNYGIYQDVKNYKSDTKSETENTPTLPLIIENQSKNEKRIKSDTINNNDNNDTRIINNTNLAVGNEDNFEEMIKPSFKVAQDWQYLALEIIEKLKVPPNKKSSFFKVCKENPDRCNTALQYAIDFPNSAIRWNMFFVKYNELKKNGNN